jgi:hypothetical protein
MGQPIPLHELREKYKNERPQREQELLGKLELVAAELHRESLWSGPDIERALVLERARREVERAAESLERDLALLSGSVAVQPPGARGEPRDRAGTPGRRRAR